MPVSTKKSRLALWIVQSVLAALFLFAGGVKLALPLAALAKLSPLPAPFLKFIGTCEVLGALGLILPGALRIKPWLTPLAAAGLVLIMIGAVITTVATLGVAPAVMPFVVGILAATVVRGRWQRTPQRATSLRLATRAAGADIGVSSAAA
ncbi:MAG TPA: DoxX family protein [Gemmatimonadales bacterium]|nr:DoxX family protein [Gemmatimonadales bacterium]